MCVSALLQYSADPNIATKDNNITPLYISCQNNHYVSLSMLLRMELIPMLRLHTVLHHYL